MLRRVPSQPPQPPPVQHPQARRPPGATGGSGWFRQLSGLFNNEEKPLQRTGSPSSEDESEGEEESEEEESEEAEEDRHPERKGSWLAGVFGGSSGGGNTAPATA